MLMHRLDVKGAPQLGHTLPHRHQSHAGGARLGHTAAVVGHLDSKIVVTVEANGAHAGLGVANDVGDRLGRDAERGDLHRGG